MKKASGILVALICLIPSAGLAGEINLSVASSLKEAATEISAAFLKQNPGIKITTSSGASGALAKQIVNGAPADIFISANPEWVEYLKKKKMINIPSTITLAYNSLVFAGINVKASSMLDLARLERIAIGSPKSVPAGEYAMGAFRKAGLDKQLGKKLIMGRDVRECLMYAERGEVDGAFVYKTDTLQAKRAKLLFTVPQELYPRVTYPLSLTVTGKNKAEAVLFYKFMQSTETVKILEKLGYKTH